MTKHPLNILTEKSTMPSWLHRNLPSKAQYSVTDNLINEKVKSAVDKLFNKES